MIRPRALALLAGLACASVVPVSGHDGEPLPALDFDPPRPGTYTLHRIMAAPDGEVLGVDGRPQKLSRFTRERITVLGFIYTTCVDPEGCPLAYRVFDTVRETITATPALRDKVRLVTLSFDPARDSPSAMRAYAGSRVSGDAGGLPWYFLTTRSARALMPLVEGFGQDVRLTVDRSSGRPRRELSHVLKVFLIDPRGVHPRDLHVDVPAPADAAQRHRDARHGGPFDRAALARRAGQALVRPRRQRIRGVSGRLS